MLVMLLLVEVTRIKCIFNTHESSQLSLVVIKIARESFSPDQILLISSSEHNGSTVDNFLNNINHYAQWNLHVFRPGAVKLEAMYQQEAKVGSCVVFTRDSDDVMKQMASLMNSTSWNNRVQFLLVATVPVANPELFALSVLQQLWDSARILDAVVLVEYNTMFQLYTWFPYQSHTQCREVSDVVLVNVWNKNDTRRVINKTLWGCPINVSITYTNSVGAELLRNFLLRLNFTILYRQNFPENFSSTARINASLQDLRLGFSDIVASVPLYKDFIKIEDPSYPVDWTGFVWHVPCAKPLHRIQKVLRIFFSPLWMALISVAMFVGVVMWQLSKQSLEHYSYKNIFIVLYNVWAVAVGVPMTNIPRTTRLRIVIFAWISYCFFMSTGFQIFFTSSLIDPGLQKQITNLDELVESKMEYGFSPSISVMYDLSDRIDEIVNRGKECDNLSVCVQRIIDTGQFAVLESKRMVSRYLSSVKKRNCVCVMNNIDIIPVKLVVLFSRRTLILDNFNKYMTTMLEFGLSTKTYEDIWITSDFVDGVDVTCEEYFVFTTSDLLVAFYTLIFGHSMSFVVFLLELLHHAFAEHRSRRFGDRTTYTAT